jgi:hypothetical protein
MWRSYLLHPHVILITKRIKQVMMKFELEVGIQQKVVKRC